MTKREFDLYVPVRVSVTLDDDGKVTIHEAEVDLSGGPTDLSEAVDHDRRNVWDERDERWTDGDAELGQERLQMVEHFVDAKLGNRP